MRGLFELISQAAAFSSSFNKKKIIQRYFFPKSFMVLIKVLC